MASGQVTGEANRDMIHTAAGHSQLHHLALLCRSQSGLLTVLTVAREVIGMRGLRGVSDADTSKQKTGEGSLQRGLLWTLWEYGLV